ncbi:N-acetyltransferase [Phocaeicola vulgatus]|nr:N-acetyltransferase [Phocaeicola vulgatus]
MEHTVIHDEKVDRFEVFESGQIAYLQYDEKNGVLDILHTIVPPTVGRAGNSSGFDRGRCEICFGCRA